MAPEYQLNSSDSAVETVSRINEPSETTRQTPSTMSGSMYTPSSHMMLLAWPVV